MKKEFETPELTIIYFVNDVITESDGYGDWYPDEPGDHDQD